MLDKNKHVFILDLDDTLYKEVQFVRSAHTHIDRLLVADYGYPEGKARQILNYAFDHHMNAFEILNSALVIDGIVIPNAVQWMLNEYRYHIPQIEMPDDSKDFIMELYQKDIDTYIITDGRAITQRNKIRALGLSNYIPYENIFISEELGCDKTRNTAFTNIYRRYFKKALDLANSDMVFIFVGDNPAKDFIVGNRFGYPTFMLIGNKDNIHSQSMIDIKDEYRPLHRVKSLNNIVKHL